MRRARLHRSGCLDKVGSRSIFCHYVSLGNRAMSPTIRIDDDVYKWLQAQAVPFEDNPNSVLRRLAGIDREALAETPEKRPLATDPARKATSPSTTMQGEEPKNRTVRPPGMRRPPLTTGKALVRRWRLPVKQARFHRDGSWYEKLTDFPAAYCDCRGYVVFETEAEVQQTPGLHVEPSKQVWVPNGILSLPGYRTADDPVRDPDS
jgi:hypothetical protein